jgi:hypothetical protein
VATLDKEAIDMHLEANEDFARSRGLSEKDIEELKDTYVSMSDVLNHPEGYPDPVSTVRVLEFKLQRQWKFPEDAKFHHYSLYIKGCTCPRMDNAELIGFTEDRYATSDCPWHWKEAE